MKFVLVCPNKRNEYDNEVFFKRNVFENFAKIHRKFPVLESLFNKVAVFHHETLFKKETPAAHCGIF